MSYRFVETKVGDTLCEKIFVAKADPLKRITLADLSQFINAGVLLRHTKGPLLDFSKILGKNYLMGTTSNKTNTKELLNTLRKLAHAIYREFFQKQKLKIPLEKKK